MTEINKAVERVQSEKQTPKRVVETILNEPDAAQFLGVSRMTLLRKRNAEEVGYYRVGFRVLYSVENHLQPFLRRCEQFAKGEVQVAPESEREV